jgi:hypothetical protein
VGGGAGAGAGGAARLEGILTVCATLGAFCGEPGALAPALGLLVDAVCAAAGDEHFRTVAAAMRGAALAALALSPGCGVCEVSARGGAGAALGAQAAADIAGRLLRVVEPRLAAGGSVDAEVREGALAAGAALVAHLAWERYPAVRDGAPRVLELFAKRLPMDTNRACRPLRGQKRGQAPRSHSTTTHNNAQTKHNTHTPFAQGSRCCGQWPTWAAAL